MDLHTVYHNFTLQKYNISNIDATLQLLGSSILVSISGALRIHLASLLLQVDSNFFTIIAAFFIIYSVYTLDRTLASAEDNINRTELNGSNKDLGLTVVVVAFLIGGILLAKEGMLIFALIPLVTGYLYSKGIQLGRYSFRLKGGLGVKNIVVCLTWGIFIVGLTGCKHFIPVAIIFLLYGVKVFINSIIDDFKDIKGDIVAGVQTLPIYLGEQKTCNLLIILHIIYHMVLLVSIIANVISFEPLILFVSFVCGLICIQKYTKTENYSKLGLALFKDLESSITLGILMI